MTFPGNWVVKNWEKLKGMGGKGEGYVPCYCSARCTALTCRPSVKHQQEHCQYVLLLFGRQNFCGVRAFSLSTFLKLESYLCKDIIPSDLVLKIKASLGIVTPNLAESTHESKS